MAGKKDAGVVDEINPRIALPCVVLRMLCLLVYVFISHVNILRFENMRSTLRAVEKVTTFCDFVTYSFFRDMEHRLDIVNNYLGFSPFYI